MRVHLSNCGKEHAVPRNPALAVRVENHPHLKASRLACGLPNEDRCLGRSAARSAEPGGPGAKFIVLQVYHPPRPVTPMVVSVFVFCSDGPRNPQAVLS